jgi:dTDP-glucose 4,6-dehydratase
MFLLIYGGNGWIGNQVTQYLEEIGVQFLCGSSRVDDYIKVQDEIITSKCTHVLSLIGRTHGKIGDKVITTIDYLEEEGKLVENIRDNLYSPLNLALICTELNIHFTYLGTGCIFENDDDHTFFTENSEPNFFGSSYSVVKGFTDKIMRTLEVLNLRIRMPINSDKNPRNFITKITTYDKICSIPNSMSVLPDLFPRMITLMKNKVTGTFNFTNPGTITHNEILSLYKEIVDPLFVWKNFTIEEQNEILKSKRSNNELSTDRLQHYFPDIKNIREAVIECLKQYPKPVYDFVNSHDTNLLVTGGCGFIGSHFINYMWKKYDNINIYNVDAMYYCSKEDNVNQEVRDSDRYSLSKKNINNLDVEFFIDNNINYVLHFAAQSHVQNSFEEALQYTSDNVLGTVKLLELTREHGKVKKFIHVSTDEVYGESNIICDESKKHEMSLLSPSNPYSASKAAAEMMVQSYTSSFKLPIVITRGNNVFGPNQYPEKLIPKFIQHLKRNEKVTVQGDGSALRSFLHVNDTVKAFDVILNKGLVGQIYNIGTDDHMEYSVMDVAKILIKKIKNTEEYGEWISYVPDRPFNDTRYYITNSKLKKLGWKVETDFSEGLDYIIEKQSSLSER